MYLGLATGWILVHQDGVLSAIGLVWCGLAYGYAFGHEPHRIKPFFSRPFTAAVVIEALIYFGSLGVAAAALTSHRPAFWFVGVSALGFGLIHDQYHTDRRMKAAALVGNRA